MRDFRQLCIKFMHVHLYPFHFLPQNVLQYLLLLARLVLSLLVLRARVSC